MHNCLHVELIIHTDDNSNNNDNDIKDSVANQSHIYQQSTLYSWEHPNLIVVMELVGENEREVHMCVKMGWIRL